MFGLAKGWLNHVKPLQDVRNDFDVPHDSLEQDAIERVEQAFNARLVRQEVIRAHITYLADSPPSIKAPEPIART